MKRLLVSLLMLACHYNFAQTLKGRLELAVQRLGSDPQLRHGILGFCVIDSKSGQIIFEHHAQLGLAPASCQKIFTSIAAFDLLGSDYRYKTVLGYDGSIENEDLQGNLHLTGSGDPTLGSWRWEGTKEETFLQEIISSLRQFHINRISGKVFLDDSKFSVQAIPDGWIWQDIGNYYGAGCWGINWCENQYDLTLQAGLKLGDTVGILGFKPATQFESMVNQITTGEKGSGDNGYIYSAPYSNFGFTQGSIPLGARNFTISGSMPYPTLVLRSALESLLNKYQVTVQQGYESFVRKPTDQKSWPKQDKTLMTHYSPSLDSLNYWFLKKSINLYGEALIKTMAFDKTGDGSTDKGVEIVKDLWKKLGVEPSALHITDGSGLSPQNRVTADALVKALRYATSRPWFRSFYSALPQINGMKMKSGSIGGAKSYAGYQIAKTGQEYIFAIIVNNFDGSGDDIVKKIWELLDNLK